VKDHQCPLPTECGRRSEDPGEASGPGQTRELLANRVIVAGEVIFTKTQLCEHCWVREIQDHKSLASDRPHFAPYLKALCDRCPRL
jgi:hypothetical protein